MVNRFAVAVSFVVGACSYSSPDPGADAAETPPIVGFEFSDSGGDEGLTEAGTKLSIPVVLNKPSSQRVTVKCTALQGAGTAEELIDFEVVTHDLVFEPGETRVEVEVDIVHDLDDTEAAEGFALALDAAEGATLNANKAIHTVLISDHILPRVAFAQTATSTTENTQTNLTVVLTAPSEGTSTVVVGVTGGATAPADGDDYAITEGTVVNIPDGAMMATVPIGEKNDPRDELAIETVIFELKGASQNLVLGTDRISTHSILDDDTPPIATIMVNSDTQPEGGSATVTVVLSEESELPITVNYARQNADDTAEDTDATVSGTSVEFAPHTFGVAGDKTKTFTIAITNDTRDELVETVIVELTTATNASVQANSRFTLSISEDANDRPTVQFALPDSTVNESANNKPVMVTLSNPSDRTVTVAFTVGGTATNGPASNGGNDFALAPGTLTFDPDSQSQTITVDIHQNPPGSEPDETVVLTLTGPTNASLGTPSVHELTIID